MKSLIGYLVFAGIFFLILSWLYHFGLSAVAAFLILI